MDNLMTFKNEFQKYFKALISFSLQRYVRTRTHDQKWSAVTTELQPLAKTLINSKNWKMPFSPEYQISAITNINKIASSSCGQCHKAFVVVINDPAKQTSAFALASIFVLCTGKAGALLRKGRGI